MNGSRRALVASDSNVANDPRVLKQVRWLIEGGWTVDSLGRGDEAPELNGVHFRMPRRSRLLRLIANTLFPKRLRYRVLVESAIPEPLRAGSSSGRYDLAVLNEIELLPWFTGVREKIVEPAPRGRVHLDLHEYAPSQRSGLVYNLLFKRYRRWQTGFVASKVFTSRSAVSPGVAALYSRLFSIPAPAVIRNVPDFVDQEPSLVDPHDIKLIYHGSAGAMRRVDLAIEAMAEVEGRFSLHLMLVGSPKQIQPLRNRASRFGSRIEFPPPVGVRDVATALNGYDLEIIFAPPMTENIRHGLPNKLFESIQGRLGIVTGESPDKAELVTSCGNGVIVEGWTPSDLARTLNSLSIAEIERMKQASHRAAPTLNSQSERDRFLAAIGQRGGTSIAR